MSEHLDILEQAVKEINLCRDAEHIKSVPIMEMDGDQIVWAGDVEVFRITDHALAELCYAWSDQDGSETRFVTVLGIPPVTSPDRAVEAYLAFLDRM